MGLAPDTHVLEVRLGAAGPFTKRGVYRVRVVLYDGFQPMEAAPGEREVGSGLGWVLASVWVWVLGLGTKYGESAT